MKFYKLLAEDEYRDAPAWYETDGEPVYILGRKMFFDRWEKDDNMYIGLTDAAAGVHFMRAVYTDYEEEKELMLHFMAELLNNGILDCEDINVWLDEIANQYEVSPLYNENHKYPIIKTQ